MSSSQNSCPSFFTGKQDAKRAKTKATRFLKAQTWNHHSHSDITLLVNASYKVTQIQGEGTWIPPCGGGEESHVGECGKLLASIFADVSYDHCQAST